MFIRSLILTVHNIHTNDPDQTELLMTNRLFKHYCSHEQRIQVVARLIGILDVSSLSQSSLTNFPEWTAVTEKLLEQDITSETSIKHYLAKSEEIGRAHGSADLPYIRWP
uniref:Uncharacterized protein n=1 Tax=Ciona savignyi TaxID=51511 RepID=H2ZFZ3_CIOSA